MKRLLAIVVIGFVLGIICVIVEGEMTYARQSADLQASFERSIQELTESNREYVVGYFEDGSIGSIFVLKEKE